MHQHSTCSAIGEDVSHHQNDYHDHVSDSGFNDKSQQIWPKIQDTDMITDMDMDTALEKQQDTDMETDMDMDTDTDMDMDTENKQ